MQRGGQYRITLYCSLAATVAAFDSRGRHAAAFAETVEIIERATLHQTFTRTACYSKLTVLRAMYISWRVYSVGAGLYARKVSRIRRPCIHFDHARSGTLGR
jgi:hypothetical protein